MPASRNISPKLTWPNTRGVSSAIHTNAAAATRPGSQRGTARYIATTHAAAAAPYIATQRIGSGSLYCTTAESTKSARKTRFRIRIYAVVHPPTRPLAHSRTRPVLSHSPAAMLAQEVHERAARVLDVGLEPLHGQLRIALRGRARDRLVLVACAGLPVRQRELHPCVSVALIVQHREDAQRAWAVGRRQQRRMKLPVQRTPLTNVAPLERRIVRLENGMGPVEMVLR